MFGKHKGRLGRRGARASLAPDVFGLPHGSPLPRPVSGVSGHAAAASSPAEGRFRTRGGPGPGATPALRRPRPSGWFPPPAPAGARRRRRLPRHAPCLPRGRSGDLRVGRGSSPGPAHPGPGRGGHGGAVRAKAAATRGTARDSGHRDAATLLRGAGRGDSRGRGDTPRRRSWEKWCARASSGAGRQPPRAPPRRTLTPSSGRYLAQVWAPLRGPGARSSAGPDAPAHFRFLP